MIIAGTNVTEAGTAESERAVITPVIGWDEEPEGRCAKVRGSWNLRGLTQAPHELLSGLWAQAGDSRIVWDLTEVQALDSAGAFLLLQAWGNRLPEGMRLRPEHKSTFRRWQDRPIPSLKDAVKPAISPYRIAMQTLVGLGDHLLDVVSLLGQLVLDMLHLLRHPRDTPLREISASIHETGGRALGITALVGFLIGVVVSYLSSLQLQTFGAEIYIVNILGLSIIRELGPLLAAILVAGRSGSAMTARLGVMRVTQELDALSAMGISQSLRLILPKVMALIISLPLLVVWTDLIALMGGAVSAHMELGIGYHQFFQKLPSTVPLANLVIGLAKGAVFGLSIALIACHFGLRIKPNTESLGNETTNSVVVAVTLVILIDAVFAILFRSVGIP